MSSKENQKGTGEIWVNDFNESSATRFREQVLLRTSKSQDVPIIIYIDSYGGYVDALAKMVDTLEQVANPIVTCCMGKAMSCGAILLSYGDYRYCAPNSRVMVHEVSSNVPHSDVHDVTNDAAEVKRLNTHFMGKLAHNCGIKGGYTGLRKIIKEKDGRDLWMSPDQALKFGIVDEVGFPQIVPAVAYDIYTVVPAQRAARVKRAKQILGIK